MRLTLICGTTPPDLTLLLHSSALIIQKLLDRSFNLIVLAFAGMLEDDLSVPVDDVLRRPVLIVVGIPRRIVVVLRDRILDAVALDRGLDIAGHLLERELRCMDPDHDESSILVGVVPYRDVRQRTSAVDAAVCPKIDEDDL